MNNFYFSEEIAEAVKEEISAYEGSEIFFGCTIEPDGRIIKAHPVCYGNDEAVLAPYELAEKYNAVLHNHPSGDIKPSSQDLMYAQSLQNQGIGFFITDNQASRLNVIVPPIVLKPHSSIKDENLDTIFCEGGKISKHKAEYEVRPGQLEMAKTVSHAFNTNGIAVIEAGTGIGKSLAYLVPAFLWAIANNERIVISTNTINLQHQLLHKDIPFIKKILGTDIKAVLVKGRRNYLCKLKQYDLDTELEYDEDQTQLNSILSWSNTTETGVIDELTFIPSPRIWEKVSSDADFCSGPHCTFYKECFLQKARRQATESNILIVNHHMLFADVYIRSIGERGLSENILLPPYKKIIFDEAHNIEKSASSYFNDSFSKSGFYKFLNLYRSKNNFILKLIKKIRKSQKNVLKDISDYLSNELLGGINLVYSESLNIFANISEYIEEILSGKEELTYSGSGNLSIQHRITAEEWEDDFTRTKLREPLAQLASLLEESMTSFTQVSSTIENLSDTDRRSIENEYKLFASYASKFKYFFNALIQLLQTKGEEKVIWIEIWGKPENPAFTLVTSPLFVNSFLYDSLFSVFDSIVLTSATLTVNNTFDFFFNQSGISFIKDEKEVLIRQYSSPFNYEKHVLFVAPSDIPAPNHKDYNKTINSFIKNSIIATRGSAFVLFTSYSQLKRSFEELHEDILDAGYRSFYQGEMEKNTLLERFKDEMDSNLFATDSFWEGVDAPGETLRLVVLAKLPFKMPSEPLEKARVEDLERRGINPFLNYTLPSAILRFRQGFGRLIRTGSDYGIVALLDSRVFTKQYGKLFFRSLPRCKFLSGNSSNVIEGIKDHMQLFTKKSN